MAQSDQAVSQVGRSPVYRAFWRWHFYAGLLVMPVLMLMALTGAVYLFKDEIETALNRRLIEVAPAASSTSPQAWSEAALGAVPGRIAQVTPPADASTSARLVVEKRDGVRTAVYVDPHDARVLGSTPEDGLMLQVKRLHSLDIAGPVFNLLVEVVAGWAIVMVGTGLVLWWPRGGGKGGIISVRGTPAKRVFWRDFHAVTGIFTGAVIVFLAVSGMPWSAVWGKEVRRMTTEAGWGRPALSAAASAPDPAHAGHDADVATLPWALQETHVHGTHHAHGAGLSLDDAVKQLDIAGLPRPYTVVIPAEAGQAWTAASIPEQVEQMRAVYLDGATGAVIADVGYGAFGPAAKAIEWGISVHQGKEYGLVNKLVMLTGCIAVWLLGVSALVMWWKRRPKGRLAAPPKPIDRRGYVAVIVVVTPLAMLYPLVGVSLLVVLAADLIAQRVASALARKQAQ